MDDRRVCIIGAGSSGLTAAKTLHERGIAFDCFERGSGVGGLWRYENDNGLSAAYRSLHINTSRDRMGFSDYPMPRAYPDFPHHSLILKYFEAYTDHFGFRERIQFQTSVLSVRPRSNAAFDVTTADRHGARQTRAYAAVLIANGHHWSPRYASFPGTFHHPMLHAHQYRTPDALAGKRVLVVGMGNSGCDIACEASRVAEKVFLSTRRGAHIIPKYIFGRPLDRVAPPWAWKHMPFRLFQFLFALTLRVSRGDLARFRLPVPRHRILEEHPTVSSDLLNLIGHGRIAIKPDVRMLDGDHVCFADGSREPIDVLIQATGYHISVPFLDPEILNPAGNEVGLYKHVVHPDYPDLYFIGLVQPWGAIMPLAEEQGKWVADLIEGKCGLPTAQAMKADIAAERAAMRRRYTDTARHTIQVDFYPYLAALRRERKRQAAALPAISAVIPLPTARKPSESRRKAA
jgi:dimethylaniline monooxygenase (N-oxide forming)